MGENTRPNYFKHENTWHDKIPQLLNSDRASANATFNPLVQRLVDNQNYLYKQIQVLQNKVGGGASPINPLNDIYSFEIENVPNLDITGTKNDEFPELKAGIDPHTFHKDIHFDDNLMHHLGLVEMGSLNYDDRLLAYPKYPYVRSKMFEEYYKIMNPNYYNNIIKFEDDVPYTEMYNAVNEEHIEKFKIGNTPQHDMDKALKWHVYKIKDPENNNKEKTYYVGERSLIYNISKKMYEKFISTNIHNGNSDDIFEIDGHHYKLITTINKRQYDNYNSKFPSHMVGLESDAYYNYEPSSNTSYTSKYNPFFNVNTGRIFLNHAIGWKEDGSIDKEQQTYRRMNFFYDYNRKRYIDLYYHRDFTFFWKFFYNIPEYTMEGTIPFEKIDFGFPLKSNYQSYSFDFAAEHSPVKLFTRALRISNKMLNSPYNKFYNIIGASIICKYTAYDATYSNSNYYTLGGAGIYSFPNCLTSSLSSGNTLYVSICDSQNKYNINNQYYTYNSFNVEQSSNTSLTNYRLYTFLQHTATIRLIFEQMD